MDLPKASNYLISNYIVLDRIRNLEVILSIEKDVYGLYANTTPFYITNLSVLVFLVWCGGSSGTNPSYILKDDWS